MSALFEPFHGDLFAELRNLVPAEATPDEIPPLPAAPLGAYDTDVQRRYTYAAGVPLFGGIYEVLERWKAARGPLGALRVGRDDGFLPLPDDYRRLFRGFGTMGELGPGAHSAFPEVFTDTYLAAVAELRRTGRFRREMAVLDDPRLSLVRQGRGPFSTERYVDRNGRIGLVICSSLCAMSLIWGTDTDEGLTIAENSEPVLLLTAPLAPVIASVLLTRTGSTDVDSSLRGFYAVDLFERFDLRGTGPAVRLKRSFVSRILEDAKRPPEEWIAGARRGDTLPARFGCLALKVTRGDLNLVQFTYRWMIEALRELKRPL